MITDKEREAARKNTTSFRKAIDLMCRECIYDDLEAGTWRAQVEGCTSPGCPLYNFRPTPLVRNEPTGEGEKRARTPDGRLMKGEGAA